MAGKQGGKEGEGGKEEGGKEEERREWRRQGPRRRRGGEVEREMGYHNPFL